MNKNYVLNITIAGYGFVGKAHDDMMNSYFVTNCADPYLLETSVLDFTDEHNAVICCVSTPQAVDGSCDVSNVSNVIVNTATDIPILIKSTISLEGWYSIKEQFPNHNLTFSPEFLVAATAEQDFLNTTHLFLGGDGVAFWSRVFNTVFDELKISELSVEQLIMIKYGRNSFLATKVAWFNELYDMCNTAGISYNEVAQGIGDDPRITTSHTQITEQRGFGGHCFPKDTTAFITSGRQHGKTLTILEAAVAYNNKIAFA